MDKVPNDILRLIFNELDDIDFIKFLSVSKYFSKIDKYNLRTLTDQYKLSKIIGKPYNFSNILYDLFEWNFELIPINIIKIEFIDEFNEDISELFKLKQLKVIKIGMFYTNAQLLENNLEAVNKVELVNTFICNKMFASELKTDIARLYDIQASRVFPRWFNKISMNVVKRKYLRKTTLEMTKENDQKSRNFMRYYEKYNDHININKYESEYHLTSINDLTNFHLEFVEFVIELMIKNTKKLRQMTYDKYNCGTFNDFMYMIWGKESWDKNRKQQEDKKILRKVIA